MQKHTPQSAHRMKNDCPPAVLLGALVIGSFILTGESPVLAERLDLSLQSFHAVQFDEAVSEPGPADAEAIQGEPEGPDAAPGGPEPDAAEAADSEAADGTEIAADAGFRRIVRAGAFTTGPERDYTVKVDAAGLAPDTAYFYRFHAGTRTSP